MTVTPVEARPFSWLQMIAGLLLVFAIGCVANVFLVMFGLATKNVVLATLISLVPGVAFALLAYALWKSMRSFAIGVLVGACIVALCGGLCGGLISAGGGVGG